VKPANQLLVYIRDLLGLQEVVNGVVQIGVGRQNNIREDYTGLQIIIDQLSVMNQTSQGEKFDGVNEQMTYYNRFIGQFTVDFYGDTGYSTLQQFLALHRSQAALELQRDNEIEVNAVSQVTNVKLLTGEEYSERYQITLNVRVIEEADIATLRIDQAQVSVQDENSTTTFTTD